MILEGIHQDLPDSATVLATFEQNAMRTPEALALTYRDITLTYGDLNETANRLAHYLLDHGIERGNVVGVCLNRSPELVVTILAILKAGAAYAPLDPTYPAARLHVMMSQLPQMAAVIASGGTSALLASADPKVMALEEVSTQLSNYPGTNPWIRPGPADPCYVIFTSGSTGVPKATAACHIGWYNLLNWLARTFELNEGSSNLLLSSFGFDITQRSIMTPLFTGSVLHLLPSRNFDPSWATRLIRSREVRTLHCAPSTLYLLIEREAADSENPLASLDFVFVGGEPLSASRVKNWATRPGQDCKLVNVYGVAECTDVSSYYVLSDFDRYARSGVPIGQPIHNTQMHILDDTLYPVGRDGVGEICITGVGVGLGYLNSENGNRQRFIADPSKSEAGAGALYRTGDLGRLSDDGQLMCVGRADNQVKVRGMRIDLGDVETFLRADHRFADAAVVAVKPATEDDLELVACVIPADTQQTRPASHAPPQSDDEILRKEFLADLPAHMVPTHFLAFDRFPLSPNGKVDRAALTHTVRLQLGGRKGRAVPKYPADTGKVVS